MRRDTAGGWVAGAIFAAALTILSVAAINVFGVRPDLGNAPGYGLVTAACAVLAVCHRLPVTALAVSVLSVAGSLLLGYPYGPVMLAVSVAVYAVARHRPSSRSLPLSAGAYLLLAAPTLAHPEALPGGFAAILTAAWIVVPATIGVSRRLVLDARARQRAETERRLRDEERLRLAHEVHDVVGHGLAAIQMQADIALHVAPSKPEQAARALAAISAASAAALSELRDALSAVAPASGADARSPVVGLDRLGELCDRIRAAGVEVRLTATGTARRLHPAVDLAAYRIIQESLTNVVKHAVSPRATVHIDYTAESVTVTVASPHDGTAIREGFGIRGIRRRVGSLDGSLSLRAGETLQLRAVLPGGGPVS